MARLKELFISVRRSKKLVSFKDALVGAVSVSAEPVPGSNETYLTPEDLFRRSTRKLVRFVIMCHILGMSFNGKLSLDEIFFTETGSLRALDYTHDSLVEIDSANEPLDALFLADSITGTIFPGLVPTDMSNLVELLRSYNSSLQHAVLLHPALRTEVGKLTQFGALYMKLRFIKVTDPAKYERIISQMPYCSISEDHWKFRALKNTYLKSVLFFNQPLPSNMKYKKIKPSMVDLYMARRALNKDPNVRKYMHPQLANDFGQLTMGLNKSHLTPTEKAKVSKKDEALDRETLFRIILDDMKAYGNNGSELIKDLRNSNQHIMDFLMDEMTKAIVALTNAPAPAPAALKKRKVQNPPSAAPAALKKMKSQNPPNPSAAKIPGNPPPAAAPKKRKANPSAAIQNPQKKVKQVAPRTAPASAAVQAPMQAAPSTAQASAQVQAPMQVAPGTASAQVQALTQAAAGTGPASAQVQAPSGQIPRLEYTMVEHIFGCHFPGALCRFFLAMHSEMALDYTNCKIDKNLLKYTKL